MDKASIKKINRNNRKRGASFEKWVADFLDMDVVPYSGSNDRFGYGDIRDSKWLGECKNITPDKNGAVTIDHKWITKNAERAGAVNKLSFIAFMERGSAFKYVLVDDITWSQISDITGICHTCKCYQVKGSHNARNIKFGTGILKTIKSSDVMMYRVDGSTHDYYIMRIEYFKYIITRHGLKGTRYDMVGGDNNAHN